MKSRNLHPALGTALAALLVLFASAALAQDDTKATPSMDASGTVATLWVMWPKSGQEQQFEAAIKEHAAWRKTAGEGFTWQIYQPVVGSDLNHYVVRSGEHTWKDMDTQAAWSMQAKADAAFNGSVGPYLDRAEHYFSETDTKHSHWIESPDYKYYGVSSYSMKPGTYADRMDAMSKIQKAVDDEKWPYAYEISHSIGGKGTMDIVTPMKSYAEMAEPDPSLMSILAKSLGSEAAAAATMKQFGGTIESTEYTVYAHRPDLSTPK